MVILWVFILCTLDVLVGYVTVENSPHAFQMPDKKEYYLFTDAFMSFNNDKASLPSIILITRTYADLHITFQDILLHLSEEVFFRPTTVNIKDFYESSVVIEYRLPREVSQHIISKRNKNVSSEDRSIGVYFTYSNCSIITPTYFMNERPKMPSGMKSPLVSMFTLFSDGSRLQLESWFKYYVDLGVTEFLMYYNGRDECISLSTCKKGETLPLGLSEECYLLSCFVADLSNGTTMYKRQFESVHFSFTPWKYQYFMHSSKLSVPDDRNRTSSSSNDLHVGNKRRRLGPKVKYPNRQYNRNGSKKLPSNMNYHHAQPQAISSAVYRSRGKVKWLMLFDIDEYALPSANFLSFPEHFASYDYETTAGIFFLNTFARFKDTSSDLLEDKVVPSIENFRKYSVEIGTIPKFVVKHKKGDQNHLQYISFPRSKMVINPSNVNIMGIHEIQNVSKGIVYYSNSTFLHFNDHHWKKQQQQDKNNKLHEVVLYDNLTKKFKAQVRVNRSQHLLHLVEKISHLRRHQCIDALLYMITTAENEKYCTNKKTIDQFEGIYN